MAFVAITILVVLIVDLVVLVAVGSYSSYVPLAGTAENVSYEGFSALLTREGLSHHSSLLIITSTVTAAIIGVASLAKAISLRTGGAKVAQSLGGTRITADAQDPLRRRLYNVVEEISIASGTPVPDVFVLEQEPGINAFAAGYTAADAAVAVTQGTLEKLNRAELQGVIAHEFSHIFNGDMRINIRLMSVAFGIMVLAILGRKFIHASRYSRRSKENNIAVVIAIGAALMIVGYVGLFFARWLKSALSRQREYLADASAVQFTRNPEGISGALKKIAAYNHSSYLQADSEEVSHMLFSNGVRSFMFATHPPLEQRIMRIEKGFRGEDIQTLAKKLKQQEHWQAAQAEKEQALQSNAKTFGGFLDIDDIIDNIGNPSAGRIAAAALLTDSFDESLLQAAHSPEWSPEVLLYCLLDADDELRDKQLLIVTQEMGAISEGKIQHLISTNGLADTQERLPLLEIAFPSLKRRPVTQIEEILSTTDKMAIVDNKIDSFEYLLSRLIRQTLSESHLPNRTRLHGRNSLKSVIEELTLVVSTLASHGQNATSPQGLQYAQKAFKAGMSSAGIEYKNLSFTEGWQKKLDMALDKIDRLSVGEKAKVVRALATTVLDDKKLITQEQEMMRVICALIHVPMPILQTVKKSH